MGPAGFKAGARSIVPRPNRVAAVYAGSRHRLTRGAVAVCVCALALAGVAGSCSASGGTADDAGASTTAPPLAEDLAAGPAGPRDPKGRPFLSPGDTSAAVSQLQRRLADLGVVAAAEPSGTYDDATLEAVIAFQRTQDLTPDGVVGTRTWAALDAPEKPENDGRRHAGDAQSDSATLAAAGQAEGAGRGAGTRQARGSGPVARAVVSLGSQTATLLDASGRPLRSFPVSSGKKDLTPVGTFRVQKKSPLTRSYADPTVSMQWMTNFDGGIGFHGIPVQGDRPLATPLGVRPVSHGCVRLSDADAKWIYDNLPNGALVVVVR